ncbi:MAG: YdcF family protein [Desulfobacterales bacterium]|nr:YdcF family protein [Desulfobacterales bacterium]
MVKRVSIWLFVTVGLVLLSEAVYFYAVLTAKRTVEAANAVVVFHGAAERNKLGYQLANDGIAPYLIISPATEKVRKKYDKQYSRCGDWRHLVEDRAETTFQNALLTRRLIRDHGLKKIVLVTDAYHMPRSYGLLRLLMIGAGVTIISCDTGSNLYAGNISTWSVKQVKRVYNEMVEFWGSMAEGVVYLFRGELPARNAKAHPVVGILRSLLLFDVDGGVPAKVIGTDSDAFEA